MGEPPLARQSPACGDRGHTAQGRWRERHRCTAATEEMRWRRRWRDKCMVKAQAWGMGPWKYLVPWEVVNVVGVLDPKRKDAGAVWPPGDRSVSADLVGGGVGVRGNRHRLVPALALVLGPHRDHVFARRSLWRGGVRWKGMVMVVVDVVVGWMVVEREHRSGQVTVGYSRLLWVGRCTSVRDAFTCSVVGLWIAPAPAGSPPPPRSLRSHPKR